MVFLQSFKCVVADKTVVDQYEFSTSGMLLERAQSPENIFLNPIKIFQSKHFILARLQHIYANQSSFGEANANEIWVCYRTHEIQRHVNDNDQSRTDVL
jgi:hypothetical protein